MLTTDITGQIVSVDAVLNLNAPHSFAVSMITDASSYQLGADVGIYRDGTKIMAGTVTGYSYNAQTKTLTITGQDKNSYTCQHDATPNQPKTLPTTTSTTLPAAIRTVNITAVQSCPAISCFGFGTYNGDTHAFIERIANSFGLHYISSPTGAGYTLTPPEEDPGSYVAAAGSALTQSSDVGTIISKIYVQKAITQASYTQIEIKNTAVTNTEQVRLLNPNAVTSGDPAKQFPKDYFLDPWTKSFITIDVPATNSIYKTPMQITPARQVQYIDNNDNVMQPGWRLQVWQGDPGVGDLPNAGATLLAYLHKGQTWTASVNDPTETATHLRIAHDIQYNGNSVTDYPHYDGVVITAHTWAQIPPANVTAWHGDYDSGDTDGRPDYNVISDEMYPNKDSFDAQDLGTQIAQRDSLKLTRSVVLPQTPAAGLLAATYVQAYDGHSYTIPATRIQHTHAAGTDQTVITGEI